MLDFLTALLRNPRQTGAIAASSELLAKSMTAMANLERAQVVVELGSGTGPITKKILERLNKDALFFVMEINPLFVKKTRERFPEVLVYEDSAINLSKVLRQHTTQQCDFIFSGLPWQAFKKDDQLALLQEVVAALKPGGLFFTFAYIHGALIPMGRRFRALLDEHFSEVKKTPIVWKNLPPAFVYCCRK